MSIGKLLRGTTPPDVDESGGVCVKMFGGRGGSPTISLTEYKDWKGPKGGRPQPEWDDLLEAAAAEVASRTSRAPGARRSLVRRTPQRQRSQRAARRRAPSRRSRRCRTGRDGPPGEPGDLAPSAGAGAAGRRARP